MLKEILEKLLSGFLTVHTTTTNDYVIREFISYRNSSVTRYISKKPVIKLENHR